MLHNVINHEHILDSDKEKNLNTASLLGVNQIIAGFRTLLSDYLTVSQ